MSGRMGRSVRACRNPGHSPAFSSNLIDPGAPRILLGPRQGQGFFRIEQFTFPLFEGINDAT